MPVRFELALYGEDQSPVPIAAWPGIPADSQLGDSMLLFEGELGEPAANDWNLGELGMVAVQLEAAARRLDRDRDALVRSAIDDADEVPYFLFRPRGDLVDVSLFFIEDSAVQGLYPVDREPGSAARLYGWLAAAGATLHTRLREELRDSSWGPIPVPRGAIVAAIREQVRLARALYASVGAELPALEADVAPTIVVPRTTSNRRNDRPMVRVPAGRIRLGLTPQEADRLAEELFRMEQRLHEPGLSGFSPLVPAAETRRRRAWLETSMPVYEVELGPFEIDVYPVTNRMWAGYARATGHAVAVADDDRFVTGISWSDADAYARHHELELPSEAEWEHAARDGRNLFTWGDAYSPQGDIAFAAPVDRPYVVGTRPETASYLGVHDLLGPFGEYCADPFAAYPGADLALWSDHFPDSRGQRTVRGGYDLHQDATCVSRRGVPPDERRTHLKFRCVRRG